MLGEQVRPLYVVHVSVAILQHEGTHNGTWIWLVYGVNVYQNSESFFCTLDALWCYPMQGFHCSFFFSIVLMEGG